jgi:hypothetical protein
MAYLCAAAIFSQRQATTDASPLRQQRQLAWAGKEGSLRRDRSAPNLYDPPMPDRMIAQHAQPSAALAPQQHPAVSSSASLFCLVERAVLSAHLNGQQPERARE